MTPTNLLTPPQLGLPSAAPLLALPPRRPQPNRRSFFRGLLRRVVILSLMAGGVYLGWKYVLPYVVGTRTFERPVTAVVTQGVLKITITDRGELESIDAVQVNCDLQGGGKLVSIIDEGKLVAKGEEVAKLDTDVLLRSINEPSRDWSPQRRAARPSITRDHLETVRAAGLRLAAHTATPSSSARLESHK